MCCTSGQHKQTQHTTFIYYHLIKVIRWTVWQTVQTSSKYSVTFLANFVTPIFTLLSALFWFPQLIAVSVHKLIWFGLWSPVLSWCRRNEEHSYQLSAVALFIEGEDRYFRKNQNKHGRIILWAILLTRSISLWTLDFLHSIDSRMPLQELSSMFSKQTAQPVQESRPGFKEPDTGIASDSCFLLCNYTQLLFLREGILVL